MSEEKFTWDDVCNQFTRRHPEVVNDILDYRPYDTMTIQIWLKDGVRIIYDANTDDMKYILPDADCHAVKTRTKENRRAMLLYFPNNLKRELELRGMTASDLSKAIGLSRASVSRYINGERLPDDETIYKMAKAIGCFYSDLVRKG